MHFRSAFSFAEVMFAVAILGVGFIMVAAVFPVATEQTRSTADEAVAAAVARDAFTTIQHSTHSADFNSVDGSTVPFCSATLTPLWTEVSTSTIDPSDSRYAWIPFYSRNGPNSPVEVTVLVIRRWVHNQFTASDLGNELVPRGVVIDSILQNSDGNYVASIEKDSNVLYQNGAYPSLAPGCFLVMTSSALSGRTYRIGKLFNETDSTISYELIPGVGIAIGDVTNNKVNAAIIGRDFVDPTNPKSGFDGPAQDIAVYTTFINPE